MHDVIYDALKRYIREHIIKKDFFFHEIQYMLTFQCRLLPLSRSQFVTSKIIKWFVIKRLIFDEFISDMTWIHAKYFFWMLLLLIWKIVILYDPIMKKLCNKILAYLNRIKASTTTTADREGIICIEQ